MKTAAFLFSALLWAGAQPPLACNTKALSAAERSRHEALTKLLRAALAETRELPEGFALRIAPAMPLAALGEWISLERKCCAFLDFQMEVPREGGAVWLRLSGPPGAKDVLRAGFRP